LRDMRKAYRILVVKSESKQPFKHVDIDGVVKLSLPLTNKAPRHEDI
jgi:hypothetical protein